MEITAHMELIQEEDRVYLIHPAKMGNHGIKIYYNVCAHKELDGMVLNVLFVVEDKFGIYMKDVNVLMVISFQVQHVKNQIQEDAKTFQTLIGIS